MGKKEREGAGNVKGYKVDKIVSKPHSTDKHTIPQPMAKRHWQTEIQSTLIQLLGTSQQGQGTLLHFHAQVNVKRNVTRSREGRRKPKACLLNVTHQLRLSAQVPQSLDTETQGSLSATAHAGWQKCPWRVRREHFLLPLLPHRFAHGIMSPCSLAQLTLLFFPNSPPPPSSFLFQHNSQRWQDPLWPGTMTKMLQIRNASDVDAHILLDRLSRGSMPGSGI